jgi:hypothetical protein
MVHDDLIVLLHDGRALASVLGSSITALSDKVLLGFFFPWSCTW